MSKSKLSASRKIADKKIGAAMVVGGGIAGIQASLDLADSGFKVYLVDQSPSIGGVMAQLDKTFPTNDCSMCILSPKLVATGRHPNIKIITMAEIAGLKGKAGNFTVKVRQKPRYVNLTKCTGCGECANVCPVSEKDEFNLKLNERKQIYRPFPQAMPNAFLIDKRGTPKCRATCPAGINVQGYIALISQGKFAEATELIRKCVPFPAVLGRVCFHPCESECERGTVDEPISICFLKRFAADQYLAKNSNVSEESTKPNKLILKEKIAIIGAGPSGLTAAWALAKKGYKAVVFEALPLPGGMLRVGIPEYRLPREVLDAEINLIKKIGVEIRTNTSIGKDLTIDDLVKDGFKAFFIATGAHKGLKLGTENEDATGVIQALDLLRDVCLGSKPNIGEKVAVIGGGNIAVDAARIALRLGAKEVCMLYRRTSEEMTAFSHEICEAEKEGIKMQFLTSPKRVVTKDGRLVGIECLKCELGEPDVSGRKRPVPIAGSEFTVEADTVIIAIGQSTNLEFLPARIQLSMQKTIKTDPLTLTTNLTGFFAGGDVSVGPSSVIEAIADGNRAADSIDLYLRGKNIKANRKKQVQIVEKVKKDNVKLKPRPTMPLLAVNDRVGNFREVELGLTEAQVIEEAKRCLACGGCSECRMCEVACQAKAVDHEQKEEYINVNVGSIILAPGFEPFDAKLKSEYGYGTYKNVVTSMEFERILSASGPYGGSVFRPSDGKIPKRIAFIQCVGSRDYQLGNSYCSSACCMYGMKEAVIAKEHSPVPIDISIFYMDMRSYGKEFDDYRNRAEKEYHIKFIHSRAGAVSEDPKTHNLIVHFANDETPKTEEFELVVLSIGMKPPMYAEKLAETLGIQLNHHNFCKTRTFSPLDTSKNGIFVCGPFSSPKDIPESVAQASGAAARAMGIIAEERGTQVVPKVYPPERDVSQEPPRIGVFVCHCGINIGGIVNVPEVMEYAKTLPNVIYAEANIYTCSQDTQKLIKEKIIQNKLNRIVVASCTPRTHEPLFKETVREAGLNPYLFEMTNIRDQCSWVHMHQPEDATLKAKDLVRSVVAKAKLLQPLKKPRISVTPVALIIGGGVSGITAALELAKQNFEVHLVEKTVELGGHMREVHYVIGEKSDPAKQLSALIEELETNNKIHVYKKSEVTDVYGFVGNFKSKIKDANGEIKELEHGIVIVATGAIQYRPTEYLYGQDPRIITAYELEQRLAKEKFNAKSVVMIQCVGARNGQNPNCSRICCGQAIKNALKIKELSPTTEVYVLYKDMRAYGFKEEFYRQAAQKNVLFINYEDQNKPKVSIDNGRLKLAFWEPVIKEQLQINPDLIVLNAAIIPNPENKHIAELLKVPLNKDGFFLEAHMKLRPVDFATEGVFLCGMAHSPKYIDESIAQACAAAARAATILSKPTLEMEGIVANVLEEYCSGCRICEKICPYGAIQITNKNGRTNAQVLEALCKGCGACGAACPTKAINMGHFTTDEILAQIDAVLMEARL